jgi:myo-inositol-1(or 4)-monophosphatase
MMINDLERIEHALEAASVIARDFCGTELKVDYKPGQDPVTLADKAINEALRKILPCDGEGWLSEETSDDLHRLQCRRVWVVDPIDGTREFVTGIPEWCISIGLVQDGVAVAGGICNPATGETFLGSVETGLAYNGRPARPSNRQTLEGATVLASRSEMKRGEWLRFHNVGLQIKPVGSVAYKLALVAAGLADVTWTLVPKHEWDIAAGVALVHAAGGFVRDVNNAVIQFNRPKPKLPGLVAGPQSLLGQIEALLNLPR